MICSTAFAVVLHIASWHSEPGFDNKNYGVGAECRITESMSLEAGVYRNSYGRESAYVAGEYRLLLGNWAVGAAIGIATNYPEGTIPIGGLTLHTPEVNGWGGRLLFGPKVYSNGGHVLHFMITKEL
jgi:hypothetical protein